MKQVYDLIRREAWSRSTAAARS
jgi:hypothetical protein